MFCIVSLLLVGLVNGHGRLVNPEPRGPAGGGKYPAWQGNAPVSSSTGADFVCRNDFAGNPTLKEITAGEAVDFRWDFAAKHEGDCALYVSYDITEQADNSRAKFFKIANIFDCKRLEGSENNVGNPVKIVMPSWLPAGRAVLRWDWYALHQYPAVEFYTQCVDVTIKSQSLTKKADIPSYSIINPPLYPENGNVGVGYRDPHNNGEQYVTGPPCAFNDATNGCELTKSSTKGSINPSIKNGVVVSPVVAPTFPPTEPVVVSPVAKPTFPPTEPVVVSPVAAPTFPPTDPVDKNGVCVDYANNELAGNWKFYGCQQIEETYGASHCAYLALREGCCFCGGGKKESEEESESSDSSDDDDGCVNFAKKNLDGGWQSYGCEQVEEKLGLSYCAYPALKKGCCFCGGGLNGGGVAPAAQPVAQPVAAPTQPSQPVAQPIAAPTQPTQPEDSYLLDIIGYYGNSGGCLATGCIPDVMTIPAEYNVLIFNFINILSGGVVDFQVQGPHSRNQLAQKIKEWKAVSDPWGRRKAALISIGGQNGHWPSSVSAEVVLENVKEFLMEMNLDGFDVDIEASSMQGASVLADVVRELRRAGYIITAAPEAAQTILEPYLKKGLLNSLNWIHPQFYNNPPNAVTTPFLPSDVDWSKFPTNWQEVYNGVDPWWFAVLRQIGSLESLKYESDQLGMLVPAIPSAAGNNNYWNLKLLAQSVKKAGVKHVGTWAVGWDKSAGYPFAKTMGKLLGPQTALEQNA